MVYWNFRNTSFKKEMKKEFSNLEGWRYRPYPITAFANLPFTSTPFSYARLDYTGDLEGFDTGGVGCVVLVQGEQYCPHQAECCQQVMSLWISRKGQRKGTILKIGLTCANKDIVYMYLLAF